MKNRKDNQESKVIITSIEPYEFSHSDLGPYDPNIFIKVSTSDGISELFPDYAYPILLDMMQNCKDASNIMQYQHLLNKYILHKDEEIFMADNGPVLRQLWFSQADTSTDNLQL